MYLADNHTHSRISPDAHDSMLSMVQAAADAGLHEICFTDHFEPYERRSTIKRKAYDWAAVSAEYADTIAQWSGSVSVRLGLELGDAIRDIPHSEQLLVGVPQFDFVIGSIHMLSGKFDQLDLAYREEPDEETCYNEVEDYLEQVLLMARWGQFDVLGHLTLPLRYMNGKRGFHITMDRYSDEIETIMRTLIENGCGIEINTNRGGIPLPDDQWLKLYRSLGGEIITLGSDAHRPSDVGKGIQAGQDLLRCCGFSKFCTFDQRKPVWHTL